MKNDQRSRLARRISRQRRALYMTQRQLAERLHVTQSAVAKWEAGQAIPALRHRQQVAAELMIAPHILFEGVDEEAVA